MKPKKKKLRGNTDVVLVVGIVVVLAVALYLALNPVKNDENLLLDPSGVAQEPGKTPPTTQPLNESQEGNLTQAPQ